MTGTANMLVVPAASERTIVGAALPVVTLAAVAAGSAAIAVPTVPQAVVPTPTSILPADAVVEGSRHVCLLQPPASTIRATEPSTSRTDTLM